MYIYMNGCDAHVVLVYCTQHRHTQTHIDTHRHTQTHTDTHRHTQTHTDTHTITLSLILFH